MMMKKKKTPKRGPPTLCIHTHSACIYTLGGGGCNVLFIATNNNSRRNTERGEKDEMGRRRLFGSRLPNKLKMEANRQKLRQNRGGGILVRNESTKNLAAGIVFIRDKPQWEIMKFARFLADLITIYIYS